MTKTLPLILGLAAAGALGALGAIWATPAAESETSDQPDDLAAVRARLEEVIGATWDEQSEDEREVLGPRDDYVRRQTEAQMTLFELPWLGTLLAIDPGADWRAVTVPVLGLFAERDTQLITDTNEPALRAGLPVFYEALNSKPLEPPNRAAACVDGVDVAPDIGHGRRTASASCGIHP